jgi:hypothetical protein
VAPPEPWSPTLADVARHIPTRTRDTRSPGSDQLLGTFSPWTTPDDGQAQSCIDAAVQTVLAPILGAGATIPAGNANAQAQARTAAEWRAAADIELAYPTRDADVRTAAMLDQRAKDAVRDLLEALDIAGGPPGSAGGPVWSPKWRAPDPPPWADRDPSEPPPGYLVGGGVNPPSGGGGHPFAHPRPGGG